MYLMQREQGTQNEVASAQFRDSVFLHSVAGHIPDLYNKLYGEEQLNDQIEWIVPENMDELKEMKSMLASAGIAMDFSEVEGRIQSP